MLERDMDPPSNDDQYLVLAWDEDEEEKEDDGLNSYWSEDDGDWFFDEEDKDFLNYSVELRILFEEKGGMPWKKRGAKFIIGLGLGLWECRKESL